MLSKLLSFLGGFKTKIIIGAVVLMACYSGYKYVYYTGYNAGAGYVSEQVKIEKAKWEASINTLQKQHESEIAKLNAQHNSKVNQLNKQIDKLKKNPTIITKYMDPKDNISEGFVVWHNRCALGEPLDTFLPAPTTNKYTIGDVANQVAINYNNCNKCIDRLTKLQQIVNDYISKQNQAVK